MTPRPHALHDALLSRVVGSAAFARSRSRSALVSEDPAAMERLCALAHDHLAALPGDRPPGVPADRLADAVQQSTAWVRHHAREVARGGLTPEQQGTLHLTRIRLLTNNPAKTQALENLGITVEAVVPLEVPSRPENARYLATKQTRMHHTLHLAC